MEESTAPPIRFSGHRHLTSRLVLSTLTGRPIRISKIRSSSAEAPGLAPHEVSFLRLLESVTNGSHIEFSITGTTLAYRPGLITGTSSGYGADIDGFLKHEIPANCTRGVSYFILPMCLLAPFSKAPFNITFTGPGVITSATSLGDSAVDTVRTSILPLFAHFGISNKLEIRVIQRSSPWPGRQRWLRFRPANLWASSPPAEDDSFSERRQNQKHTGSSIFNRSGRVKQRKNDRGRTWGAQSLLSRHTHFLG